MSVSRAETDPRYYGWLIVVTCFVVIAVASGSRFTFGVIFERLVEDFDASRTAISFTSSVRLVAYAASQPIMGRLIDRYSPVYVFTASIVLFALGLVGSAFATTLLGLYVTLGALIGFGFGGVSALAIASILSRWFSDRRGFAVSAANSGFNIGQLAIVPAVGFALATVGWEVAMLALGAAMLATALPAYLVVRPTRTFAEADADGDGPTAVEGQIDTATLREAIRTRSFLGMSGGYFFCGFTDFIVIVHLVAYLTGDGMSLSVASGSLGLMGGASFVGVLVTGWLSDRMKTKNTLTWLYAIRIGALVLLAQVTALGALRDVAVYVFIATFGVTLYATAPLTSTLATDLYGDRLMGSVFGWASATHQVGAAIGAAFAGFVFDVTGAYPLAFYVGAVGVAIGAAATYLVEEQDVRGRGPAG